MAAQTAANTIRIALALSLGAAVSLGITRFAYGLLLPPMRADLGWSYALAGAMNTSNAAGYLLGALVTPLVLPRVSVGRMLVWSSLVASLLMAVSGLLTASGGWMVQRFAAGVASAFVLIAGGVLATRMAAADPGRGSLLIGLYYGGTGIGISLSALLIPLAFYLAGESAHAWVWGWVALALLCFVSTAALQWAVVRLGERDSATGAAHAAAHVSWRVQEFGFGLAAYSMFGLGYIGYMTFVVALLREQGQSAAHITVFYTVLGLAVVLSPSLWAALLDRFKDGRPLALLNALLGVAIILPALSSAAPVLLASGILFGAVFLSVVSSTTAFVRHSLPPADWAGGIGAFTIAFAAGQIVGPVAVGWISDGPGGLGRGFVVSALALWVGAGLALGQRARQRAVTAVP